jgi:hypothetical protein
MHAVAVCHASLVLTQGSQKGASFDVRTRIFEVDLISHSPLERCCRVH